MPRSNPPVEPIAGLIFDLDGTLVDSHLDFDAMCREMELPDGVPILETILTLDESRAARCWEILRRHEHDGAQRAALVPGVEEFLAEAARRGLLLAVLTRNGREFAHASLERHRLRLDPVMTRDDGPIKLSPEAIWVICRRWELTPERLVMIGDYRFDIEAGCAAGTRTVLYTRQGALADRSWAAQADFLLHSFQDAAAFWRWIDQPI